MLQNENDKSMTGWKEYKLGEIAEIQTGPFGSQLHASDYVASGIPCVMPTNIGSRLDFKMDSIVFIKESDAQRLNRHILQEGDIIYSRRGDVEKCAYVKKEQNGWFCGTGCLKIRIFGKDIDSNYVAYYLSLPDVKSFITNNAVGTTMLNLNTSILSEIIIQIPNFHEQLSIKKFLNVLDLKIDLLHKQNKTLEDLVNAIFRKLISNSNILTTGSFSKFVENTIGGEWGKEEPDQDYTLKVNCVRGTDIADLLTGIATRCPVRFIKQVKFNNIEPLEGDLIIEISGGSDDQSTGRTIYINNDIKKLFSNPIIFSNFCRLIRPSQKEFMFFLYSYISHLYKNDEFFNLENGSSGIRNLDYKSLLFQLEYPMPEESKIIEFNKEVEPLFKKINKNKLQILNLQKLRDTLLPKLMTGEMEIKE